MNIIYVASLGVQFVGLVLHVIGLGTPEWSFIPNTDITFGLWENCIDRFGCIKLYDKSDRLMATEAFCIIAMFSGIAGLALAIVYIAMPVFGKSASAKMPLLSMVINIFTLVCVLITVIIWGAGIHMPDSQEIGYSFAFVITGGILMALGGVLSFVGAKFEDQ